MEISGSKVSLIIIPLLFVSLSLLAPVSNSRADSPMSSFPNQQILDSVGDWSIERDYAYYPLEENIENCKLGPGDFHSPDISSVDYISDGKTLNATLWLSSPFREHSPDKFLESLGLGWLFGDRYMTLPQAANNLTSILNSTYRNFTLTDSNFNSTLAGRPAFTLLGTGQLANETKVRVMNIGTLVGNKVYDVNFVSELEKFPSYLPSVLELIDSVRIDEILPYYDSNARLSILYPSEWVLNKGSSTGFKPTLGSSYNSSFILYPPLKSGSDIPNVDVDVIIEDLPKNVGVLDLPNNHSSFGDSLDGGDYLNEFLNQLNNGTFENLNDVNLVEPIRSTIAGLNDSYKMVYTYNLNGTLFKHLIVASVSDGKVYLFNYDSELENYSRYLPIVENMTDSLTIEQMLPYRNSVHEIALKYPYDWNLFERDVYPDDSLTSLALFYSPMKVPFILDNYRENFVIGVENLADVTTDLASYTAQQVQNIKGAGSRIIDFNTNDTFSGNPAYNITYIQKLDGGIQVKLTEKGTKVGNKIYFILYRTETSETSESRRLPEEIKAIIESAKKERLKAILDLVQIERQGIEISTLSNEANPEYVSYHNITNGISMRYPSQWEGNDRSDAISLIPLYDEGSAQARSYALNIDIFSNYDTGTDYLLNQIWNAQNNYTWTTNFMQLGPEQLNGYISKPLNSHYNKTVSANNSYVELILDLEKLNHPGQYQVSATISDIFTHNGHICKLRDFSNWISLPPASINITASPSSLLIRPGEQKNIEVKTSTNSNLDSHVFLSSNTVDGLQLEFVPTNMSLLASSSSSSTLKVEALDYTIPGNIYSVIINALISTSTPSISGNQQFNNTMSTDVSRNIPVSITILPPLTYEERFNSFYKSWVTPTTGLWTLLVGIGAVVGPLFLRWYRKR